MATTIPANPVIPPNRIVGKIVARDTRRGIGDLLVVIYDMDPTTIREPSSIDDVATMLRGTTLGFWSDFPGDRLGSVLTNPRGVFGLEYRETEFQILNREKRPDLMLLVLAPDESSELSGIGLHPMQRLLHFAMIPRARAGRIESYNIALKAELLEKHGLRATGERRQDAASFRRAIDDRHENTTAFRTAVREHLATSRGAQLERSLRVRRDAWRWFAAPQMFAPNVLFVAPGSDATPIMETARARGIEDMRMYAPARLPSVTLTVDDVRSLDPEGTGRVNMCDALRQKGFGTELVRVRNLIETVREQRRARGQLPLTTTPPGPDDDDDDDSNEPRNVGAEELRQIIRDRIVGQVEELPMAAPGDLPQALTDLAKVKAAIDKLELSGGPADVTAFHDYFTLQLAFKNVWTAAFDERLSDDAAQLYETVVQLSAEFGVSVPDIETIRDVNEFRRFLAEITESGEIAAVLPVPADVLQVYPQLTMSIWNRLSDDGRSVLQDVVTRFLTPWSAGEDMLEEAPSVTREELDAKYETVMRTHLTSPLARAERLALDLADRLGEPYAFHYFAPYSVNFGLVSCYRQEWVPETYQAGKLVSTIPLAPNEKRVVKVKQTRRSTRIQKEIEKALSEQSSEGQIIARAESEIMARANTTTNFQMSSTGTLNFAIGSMTATSQFGINQTQESTKNLKRFDEATRKTAEKVRQERELHAEVTEVAESETEATHELENKNDDVLVTYLLYELERRYRVTARLHRVTPVIMVALDMPAPHEITDAWLLEHAWILRRVLLDDSFRAAFDMLEAGRANDEMQVDIRRANWSKQNKLLDKLETMVDDQRGTRDELRQRLIATTERQGRAEATELSRDVQTAADILDPLGFFHDRSAEITADILEVERRAVETRLGHAESALEEAQKELARVQSALSEATDAYGTALREQARRQTRITQLRIHLRQNIFHYMHAIWSTKHPDELLFDLYHREIQIVQPATTTCTMRPATPEELAANIPGISRDGQPYVLVCDPPAAPTPANLVTRTLIQIADLDSPMGFKGNYVLFPLKECTHITDYMMQEYIDDYFGVRDPALDLPVTTDELLRYAAEIWHDPDSGMSEADRATLRALVLEKLSSAGVDQQTIIVPTGQVYMEAIKGEAVLLEEFKRAHRGMDVLKVQEEVRSARLENLRRAARLADNEPMLDAVHADKMIMIQGNGAGLNIHEE